MQTRIKITFRKRRVSLLEMPKRCAAQKIVSRAAMNYTFRCTYCRRILSTKKDVEFHKYVCEKIPQKRDESYLFQNTLWR